MFAKPLIFIIHSTLDKDYKTQIVLIKKTTTTTTTTEEEEAKKNNDKTKEWIKEEETFRDLWPFCKLRDFLPYDGKLCEHTNY